MQKISQGKSEKLKKKKRINFKAPTLEFIPDASGLCTVLHYWPLSVFPSFKTLELFPFFLSFVDWIIVTHISRKKKKEKKKKGNRKIMAFN